MTSYVTDAGSRYLVRERYLEAAYAWLEDRGEYAYRLGTIGDCAILSADFEEEMWCGEMGCGWREEVIDFMLRFCRPSSYACFRQDDTFEYTLVWKDSEGCVHMEYEEWENPYQRKMMKLGGANGRFAREER